ncbi:uncharacterized protein EAE97_009285 [Botrytis byssoidea]|uniref:Uncharacterized protein n=1 Tax=Botrytis byssoidea TaxID=139641 RepID=A0A9P5LYH8_9HELO|nr:uncharacterized protein EAE97_009285 [Botrytis byssoidea]KAF7931076.1 hypothetical protein EAE97_009285 [Botrytis byssoidea]
MDTSHPGHIDDLVNTPSTPLNQQVIPGYQYPFSLAPESFPEVFYRLHRTENWMDIHSSPATHLLSSQSYNPPEHGWSAKDTQTPLPSSPREILALVRNHFSEKSAYASTPSNSIFVPGVWRAGKSSKVSLWDNAEDAREEGRRIGGVQIFEVGGVVLREGGSVVFCLEELLGRCSALYWVTRGRYGRVGSGGKGRKNWRMWGKGGKREGEGLRGKAYLVVGVIPGTHNLPHPSPIIRPPNTTNTNIDHAFDTQNEQESVTKEGMARVSSYSSISTYGRKSSDTVGEFDFDFGLEREQDQKQIQATSLSQIPRPSSHSKYTSLRERKYNPGVFKWTLENAHANDIREYEIERDVRRRAQGMKRNSTLRKMEKISEDIGDGGSVDESVGAEERGLDIEGEREWSWGEDEREREEKKEKEKDSNSKRRIISTARITRKGTFGERFREKSAVFQDVERVSLRGHSFASHSFDRSDCDDDGRGGMEGTGYVDTGTSICDRILGEEYNLEDNLSAGEGTTAFESMGVMEKRGGVCEVLKTNDGCDDVREESGDGKSNVLGKGVRGKKFRREENDFDYEHSEEREREEVSLDSRMSSFVGVVNDGNDVEEEEEEDLQHEDTDFDIETTEREKSTHHQTATRSIANSKIPIEYLKSRRPIPGKTISRDTARDN